MVENRHERDQQAGTVHTEASITFRPRVAQDDAGIVELYSQQEADSAPLTVAGYRADHDDTVADRRAEEWVAVETEHLVGVGEFSPAWWTGDTGVYSAQIRVDQSRWRWGIGSRLYDLLQSRLDALEATRLLCWVREDVVRGRRFAARHGFGETGQVIEEYCLYVPEAATDAYEGLKERLRRDGVRMASLAELGTDDEVFLRALQGLTTDAHDQPPDSELLRDSFSSWRQRLLHTPGISPETYWVALEGNRPVGITFLKWLSDDAAENDYTMVAATHRCRRIAPALKLQAIAWARAHGVTWFHTSSEVGNAPMIAINRRLGYQPGIRRLEVARDCVTPKDEA